MKVCLLFAREFYRFRFAFDGFYFFVERDFNVVWVGYVWVDVIVCMVCVLMLWDGFVVLDV